MTLVSHNSHGSGGTLTRQLTSHQQVNRAAKEVARKGAFKGAKTGKGVQMHSKKAVISYLPLPDWMCPLEEETENTTNSRESSSPWLLAMWTHELKRRLPCRCARHSQNLGGKAALDNGWNHPAKQQVQVRKKCLCTPAIRSKWGKIPNKKACERQERTWDVWGVGKEHA